MKMVKSLLLGTAAGLVAMSGAQAADLPVKANPVQYVKICSLYGAGFYYIPGTDMCLKVGGWVRQQLGYGVNGNLTLGALVGNLNTRATQDYAMRTRGYITADARNQTEYGTVRSYIAVGLSQGWATGTTTGLDIATGGDGFSANRAFIQFAGFTFGLSQSFFDFYSGPATAFFGGNINPSEDTGDGGKAVTAYTLQFGNGFSASISAESQRNAGVFTANSTAGTLATINTFFASSIAGPPSTQEGMKYPDFVGNLRVDQAWGSAQIMGAIHDASGQYVPGLNNNASASATNAMGWAVGAGIKLLAPMIGQGDYLQAEVNYSEGAEGYINIFSGLFSKYSGGTYGFGLSSDNVIDVAGGNHLTTAWGVNAAYEHFWNKSWQTSVYGGYSALNYDAVASDTLCHMEVGAGRPITAAVGTCDNNWSLWNIGTRTQWNVDSQTSMGIDIVYQQLNTANSGVVGAFIANGTQAAGTRTIDDQSAWMGQFRIHRNFYP
jgi:hypothetical protein